MCDAPRPGKCYENTLQALMAGKYEAEDIKVMLCHGYPRLTKADGDYPAGTLYGHAWLELYVNDVVLCADVLTGLTVFAEQFYHVGQINPDTVARYTKEEAWEAAKLHRHNGPWGTVPPGVAFLDKNKKV